MKRTTMIVLATLTFASSVATGPVSAAKADSPSPLDQLDFPLGDWNCTGNLMAMGNKPGHATSARAHSEKTLDGSWVAIHYDEERTSANSQPYHVVQYFGYDNAKKQFVSVTLDNSASGYGIGTSPGWKGNALTIDERSPLAARPIAYRDTFTRNGADEFTHTGTTKDKNRKWIRTDQETCRKP